MRTNIGLFGGTFNPPHKGHMRAARRFCEIASLSRLYVMPSRLPPHKEISHPDHPSHRFNMAALCFSDKYFPGANIAVSDYEINRNCVSYTIDTVNFLLRKHGQNRIYLYVGSDMFHTLEDWKDSDQLFERCVLVTAPRDEEGLDLLRDTARRYEEKHGAECIVADLCPIIVTSTFLREIFTRSEPIPPYDFFKNLLTEEVYWYIIDRKLYGRREG